MASADLDARVARLGMAAVFSGVEVEALEVLARGAELRPLKRGQVLWKQGSYAHELAFVWAGQLNVVRRARDRITYRAVPMNEVIGFSNAIGRARCSVDVVAAEPSRVLIVPGDVLRGAIPRYPEIAFRALLYMGELVARLSDDVELLRSGDLVARLERQIAALARGKREVVATHADLAERVGARRESVTRALKTLEERGLVRCARGRIEILEDLDA